jgi:hypothetical protein
MGGLSGCRGGGPLETVTIFMATAGDDWGMVFFSDTAWLAVQRTMSGVGGHVIRYAGFLILSGFAHSPHLRVAL